MSVRSIKSTAEEDARRAVDRGGRLIRKDAFAVVFVLIVLTILVDAFLGDGTWGMVVSLVTMSVTLVVTLGTSDVGPVGRRVGILACLLGVVGIVAATALDYNGLARLAYMVLMIILGVMTPVVIARRLLKHPYVSMSTVAGAADIYLLVGLLFAVVYGVIGVTGAGLPNVLTSADPDRFSAASAFFIASRPVGPADFIYYSFVTLTTVGYGDLTSALPLGRMLSVAEALFGQLYLVTVVAILVANMRGRRQDADGLVSSEEELP